MYRTNDGEVLLANTPEGVVAELREKSMTPTASDAKFMRETASRISMKLEKRISCANAEDFVRGLVACGLLISEDDFAGN